MQAQFRWSTLVSLQADLSVMIRDIWAVLRVQDARSEGAWNQAYWSRLDAACSRVGKEG